MSVLHKFSSFVATDLIPVRLPYTVWLAKLVPLIRHLRVRSKYNVARKSDNLGRGVLYRLVVEQDVPYTWSAVLRCSRRGRVEEELLAGGVCAEKGSKVMRADGLVFEQANQGISTSSDRWK